MIHWERLAPAIHEFGIDNTNHLYILDVDQFENLHVPLFPPNLPVLIHGIHACDQLELLKKSLDQVYPPEHIVECLFVSDPGSGEAKRHASLSLASIRDISLQNDEVTIYIPPLGEQTSFEEFSEIIAHLRDPQNGCPWDLKQTHQSLRSHLLSETYEVLTALDSADDDAMAEELGDLLLQIVLHAQIASERGAFNLTQIINRVSTKIINRHPHVFGDLNVADVQGVLRNWEKLKAAERNAHSEEEGTQRRKGSLDGVPLALPALIQAQEYLERTERIGMAWKTWQELADEIAAVLDGIRSKEGDARKSAEFGKILFKIVNLASIAHVDAESSLREENQEFRKRTPTLAR